MSSHDGPHWAPTPIDVLRLEADVDALLRTYAAQDAAVAATRRIELLLEGRAVLARLDRLLAELTAVAGRARTAGRLIGYSGTEAAGSMMALLADVCCLVAKYEGRTTWL